MKRWQYSVVQLSEDAKLATEQLNSLGHEGWEAVSVYEVTTDMERQVLALLKRPRPAEPGGFAEVDIGMR